MRSPLLRLLCEPRELLKGLQREEMRHLRQRPSGAEVHHGVCTHTPKASRGAGRSAFGKAEGHPERMKGGRFARDRTEKRAAGAGVGEDKDMADDGPAALWMLSVELWFHTVLSACVGPCTHVASRGVDAPPVGPGTRPEHQVSMAGEAGAPTAGARGRVPGAGRGTEGRRGGSTRAYEAASRDRHLCEQATRRSRPHPPRQNARGAHGPPPSARRPVPTVMGRAGAEPALGLYKGEVKEGGAAPL